VKPDIQFVEFPKIARWSREVIVTEKIDGTNAQIYIPESGDVLFAGSRSRWITPEEDNFGFAARAQTHKEALLKLGPGSHFGEWWGAGIQRRYGLTEKRFSLFNVSRWGDPITRPVCCGVVPTLWTGNMDELNVEALIAQLRTAGSLAAPGFMKPEGVVIYHVASKQLFKKTLEKDEMPKSAA
jgi:hypothetical protein